jgi:hypothetical protein
MRLNAVLAVIASLALCAPNAFADSRRAVDTTGKTAHEIIGVTNASVAFVATEARTPSELAFRHIQSGVICRVPTPSRMWLYVGRHDTPGHSVSCYFVDDYRNLGIVVFRQPLGQTLEDQMKVADYVCLRHMAAPAIISDDLWDSAATEAPEIITTRYRGEVENEGSFFCAASVAVVDGWTLIYSYLARVYSDEEAEQWDRDALRRWRGILREMN